MKTILSTFLLTIGIIVCTNAQNNTMTINESMIFAQLNNSDGKLSYEQIQGTPYTSDTLQEAILEGQEKVYLIRYDAYKGMIHYTEKNGNGILQALSAKSSQRFNFVNKSQFYTTLVYPNLEKGFGLVVWNNGEGVELIKRETITFEKGKNADGGYGAYIADSFSAIKEDYFIRLEENGEVVRIPSKKKDILQFLGQETEKRAKKEKLNPRKEQDLIKLLAWKYRKQ